MICPEISNFPSPKVSTIHRTNQNVETIIEAMKVNNFYKSIIITCPDEINVPSSLEEIITEDSDSYKLSGCPLTEFVDNVFIKSFVRNGKLYCLSADRNCIVKNCVAITPDGILTLHVLDYTYQTLGLEGSKRPHNYYEVNIDLKNIKNTDRIKHALRKLGTFDFHIYWEPHSDDVCPSTVARYFHNKDIDVTLCSLKTKKISPQITQVPSLENVEIEEIVEWVGMLSHNADLNPDESYISTYIEPECSNPLETKRIALLVVKGFLTSTLIVELCTKLSEYVSSRSMSNYWACLSVQSEDTLRRWNFCTPRMFLPHNTSDNMFFTQNGHITYSISQLKYS
ncbi:PREDICTED: uncharacterized protein LOC106109881 [Papilio polytes]|uniref:uncharacterized protein LOC106109881 n=1 Tax=Papilio polytes TaxID=76194 RepID=UPI0006768BD0|nr:PREDICTED: uncharacterized protein LOC106109881 [Papilio polytes]